MFDLTMLATGLGFLRCRSHTPSPATDSEGVAMFLDYSLAGLVTAGLLFYLTFALLRDALDPCER